MTVKEYMLRDMQRPDVFTYQGSVMRVKEDIWSRKDRFLRIQEFIYVPYR